MITITELETASLKENMEFESKLGVKRKTPANTPITDVIRGMLALWYGFIVQIRCIIKNVEEIIRPPEKYVIAKAISKPIIITFNFNMPG